jgi:hypothetical protein
MTMRLEAGQAEEEAKPLACPRVVCLIKGLRVLKISAPPWPFGLAKTNKAETSDSKVLCLK